MNTQAAELAAASGAHILYTTHNVQRGVALTGDAAAIRALAVRDEVAHISRIVPKKRMDTDAAFDTQTLAA